MRRAVARLLVAFCVAVTTLVVPAGLSGVADAATTTDVVLDDSGKFKAAAEFNSGLHYWHQHGHAGPGVNAFVVIDRCNDELRPGVTWAAGGAIQRRVLDDCTGPIPMSVRSIPTNYRTEQLEPMTWYTYVEDSEGSQKHFGQGGYQDDWMGSYSNDPDSSWFFHSSVYKEDYAEGGKTVTVSVVPTRNAVESAPNKTSEVWEELLRRTPLPDDLTTDQRQSLYKQLYCHMAWALPGVSGGPTWDLEAERPNIPWDQVAGPSDVAKHECNWTSTGDGGWGSVPPVNGEPDDLAPYVDAGPDVSGDEGAELTLTGSAADDGGMPAVEWSYRPLDGVDEGATCDFSAATEPETGFRCTDDGRFEVTLTADDGVNHPVSDSAVVTVANVAPRLDLEGPQDWDVYRVEDEVHISAPFTDPGGNDTHTCTVTWDDGQQSHVDARGDTCDVSHAFTHAGMNTINVRVTDDDGGTDDAETMIVVYDPRAGLLVGAGKVQDASFVTTAKYPFTNSTTPLGAVALTVPTEDGHLHLVSTALAWLVITPEAKAVVKGRAHDYGFLGYLTADGFRGVVWPLSQGTNPPEDPLYDTSAGASWDVDDTDLESMTVGLTVIDSSWFPGLPPFPPPLATE